MGFSLIIPARFDPNHQISLMETLLEPSQRDPLPIGAVSYLEQGEKGLPPQALYPITAQPHLGKGKGERDRNRVEPTKR